MGMAPVVATVALALLLAPTLAGGCVDPPDTLEEYPGRGRTAPPPRRLLHATGRRRLLHATGRRRFLRARARRLLHAAGRRRLLRAAGRRRLAPPRTLPTAVDWRAAGAVTVAQSQGRHGTCWAFAAVGAIEGLHQINQGSLLQLSKQEVIDCAPRLLLNSRRNAFDWVRRNGGIASEEEYPYAGHTGTCDTAKLKSHAATIRGYSRTANDSELALMEAVARQPVAVSMSVSPQPFQRYQAGSIFEGPCATPPPPPTTTSHAMLVVGYGSTADGRDVLLDRQEFLRPPLGSVRGQERREQRRRRALRHCRRRALPHDVTEQRPSPLPPRCDVTEIEQSRAVQVYPSFHAISCV